MSVESTANAGKVQLPALRDPSLADKLATAREINARPKPDPYFVCDLLGQNFETASAVRKKLMKFIHPDHHPNLTAADRRELEEACKRVSVAWSPIAKSKVVPVRSEVERAEQATSYTEDVIIMAATFADSGLRAARETATSGLNAARQAWRRKVEDGTVDAVRTQVITAATDLFEAGRGWLGQRWSEAIKRADDKDTEA